MSFRFTRPLAALLTLFLAALPGLAKAGQPLNLVIVHVNDTHSHLDGTPSKLKIKGKPIYLDLGGMPRLASKLKQVRGDNRNVLFLHAGDAVQGTLYFTKYHGQVAMEILNALCPDAMVLGNHEFDRGPQGTSRIVGWASFPILAANLDASGEPALRGKARPFLIKKIDGAKVGIIGIITPQTAIIANAGPTLRFKPVLETARKYAVLLSGQGINKIILLTHQGFKKDLALARQVPGVDLIVGGHSHTLLGDSRSLKKLGFKPAATYPIAVKGPAGDPVYVVQAWEWAKAVGVLKVAFDKDGRLQQVSGGSVLLAADTFKYKDRSGKKVPLGTARREKLLRLLAGNQSIEVLRPQARILAMLAPYRAGLAKLRKTVVAQVARDLLHIREPGVHPSGRKLPQGSMVAPLVARAMLWKARSTGMRVAFALQNAGGVRSDLLAGPLTVAEVYRLLPFGNNLYLLDLRGSQVIEALEWGLEQGEGAFLYPAGARFKADLRRPPGARVTEVKVLSKSGRWTPLDREAWYRVVTNSFVAHGGDGYAVFKKAGRFRYDTGFGDAEVFMAYAKMKGVLRPSPIRAIRLRATK